MTTIYKATARFFDAWYQEDVYMTQEEWIYIGLLIWACVVAFGVGLLIGLALWF